MFAIAYIGFILELNLRTIRLGYFVTMNVGNLSLSKINTVMGERESLNFIKERGK